MPSVQAFALIGEARPGNCQLQIQTPPVKTGGAKDCIRTFIQTSKLHHPEPLQTGLYPEAPASGPSAHGVMRSNVPFTKAPFPSHHTALL